MDACLHMLCHLCIRHISGIMNVCRHTRMYLLHVYALRRAPRLRHCGRPAMPSVQETSTLYAMHIHPAVCLWMPGRKECIYTCMHARACATFVRTHGCIQVCIDACKYTKQRDTTQCNPVQSNAVGWNIRMHACMNTCM